MAVRDPQSEWLRVQIYRRMTPQERVQRALNLMAMTRSAAITNIRMMHPGISDADVNREWRRRILSRDLFARVERYLTERST